MSVDMQVATEEDGRLLSARIADEIRSAVLSGEMRPGMRIRQELLAAKFGASRIPVREALKQLENEGLVVLAPNRGAWIADVNSEESIEVYRIREVVEPLAIFESVPYLTDADIAALDAMINELERVTTLERYIQLDREFHLRTYSRARMPQLQAMVERFWNSTQHFRRRVREGDIRQGWIAVLRSAASAADGHDQDARRRRRAQHGVSPYPKDQVIDPGARSWSSLSHARHGNKAPVTIAASPNDVEILRAYDKAAGARPWMKVHGAAT